MSEATELRPEDFHLAADWNDYVTVSCPVCVGGSPGEIDERSKRVGRQLDRISEVLEVARAHIADWHPPKTETAPEENR